jgi:transcriptional regulator with XRE-family HTH domain
MTAAPALVAIDDRSFGELLREWRTARGTSQLALSVRTSVSTRHLSYLETGRARPSREMVVLLAQAFEMPLRDRNAFLQAAGFAAMYRETPLHAQPMGPVRDAIELLLRSTEPNPMFVLNRRSDILAANEAGRWLMATFNEDLGAFAEPYNIARLLVSPRGERRYIENWAEVTGRSLARLERELGGAHARDSNDEELLKMITAALAEIGSPAPDAREPPSLVIPVRFRREALALNLFSTIATLGSPIDVTLQELRIEMFFPADEASKRVLESRGPRRPGRKRAGTPAGGRATAGSRSGWSRRALRSGR